jgi:hypothetical protein
LIEFLHQSDGFVHVARRVHGVGDPIDLPVEVCDYDVRAFLDERDRVRLTVTPTTGGDDGYSAVKFTHCALLRNWCA